MGSAEVGIGVVSVVIAAVGIGAAFFVPEVRKFLHLDDPHPSPSNHMSAIGSDLAEERKRLDDERKASIKAQVEEGQRIERSRQSLATELSEERQQLRESRKTIEAERQRLDDERKSALEVISKRNAELRRDAEFTRPNG